MSSSLPVRGSSGFGWGSSLSTWGRHFLTDGSPDRSGSRAPRPNSGSCNTGRLVASKTMLVRRSLQYTGVLAVVTVWTSLLAATAVSRFDLLGENPLSYMGTDARSAALFMVGLVVPALLLAAFHQYLRARYPVSAGFSLAMLGGLAGQMVAAFVPIGGDPTLHRIHTGSALVLGVSLPLLMWRFAAGQPPGPWRRLTYRLFWAEAAACAVGLYLSARNVAPVAEILPGAVFHAWVVTVTFATVSGSPAPTGRSAWLRLRLAPPAAAVMPHCERSPRRLPGEASG
jgi:hypothetical protein